MQPVAGKKQEGGRKDMKHNEAVSFKKLTSEKKHERNRRETHCCLYPSPS
jgi:hypothetical protein